jgi:hypothetical protein
MRSMTPGAPQSRWPRTSSAFWEGTKSICGRRALAARLPAGPWFAEARQEPTSLPHGVGGSLSRIPSLLLSRFRVRVSLFWGLLDLVGLDCLTVQRTVSTDG